jgi:hypothetical protein
MEKVLQPLNEKAASIIAEHIDLLDAQHVVPELLQLVAHVSAMRVILARWAVAAAAAAGATWAAAAAAAAALPGTALHVPLLCRLQVLLLAGCSWVLSSLRSKLHVSDMYHEQNMLCACCRWQNGEPGTFYGSVISYPDKLRE